MTNEEFVSHQATLGLNNRQLAERIGADEGSVSKWRKNAAIPEYIAGYIELLVAVHLKQLQLALTLGETLALSAKAEKAGMSVADYLVSLIRADVSEQRRTYAPAALSSSRLNEPPPES